MLMSHYHFQSSGFKKKKHKLKLILVISAVLLMFIVSAIFVAIDTLHSKNSEASNVQTSAAHESIHSASLGVFRSKYFQFQADTSWHEVSNETTENIYTYRSMRGSLVEHDLRIYINSQPQDLNINRVQPVTIKEKTRITPNGPISDHCKSGIPKGSPLTTTNLTLAGVSFSCHPDGAIYTVLAADTKGQASFQLERPDGTLVTYTLIYRDLTANPDGSKLKEIVSSLQSR